MKQFIIRLVILLLILSITYSFSPQAVLAEGATLENSIFMDGDCSLMQSDQTKETNEMFDCADVTDIPPSECEALLDFYASTNGDGWNDNTGWLVEEHIDSWYGVTVAGGHVTILSLYSNNLSGSIPETIGQLPYLTLLELAGNQLSGSIPESLGLLIYLEEACFTNNQLTGPIPDTLGGMSSLLRLSFNENQLSGEIPASLGNLTNLTKFSIARNELEGPLPESLGQLVNVEKFEVYVNNLSGALPQSLRNLSQMKEFLIFENSFSGSIPLSYTNLTSVTDFYFFGTQLCEPTTPAFLAWKALVGAGWQSTDMVCMDYSLFLPTIFK